VNFWTKSATLVLSSKLSLELLALSFYPEPPFLDIFAPYFLEDDPSLVTTLNFRFPPNPMFLVALPNSTKGLTAFISVGKTILEFPLTLNQEAGVFGSIKLV